MGYLCFCARVLCVLVSLLCLPGAALSQQGVVAMAAPDVLGDYVVFLAGRDPLAIMDFSGPGARRDVIELVLLQQALARGGLDAPVEFVSGPSYERILEEVRKGDVDVTASSCWLHDMADMSDEVGASPALIPDGRFEAGLYTASDNVLALAARTLEDVQALRAVCSRQWVPDWHTLCRMGIVDLSAVHSWERMVRMVVNGRADFLLAPFQNTPSMVLTTPWGMLVPIAGVKVGLDGSRHFMVHKATERGRAVLAALDQGLQALLAEGVVERAYRQCGFYNARVESWRRLQ